METPFKIPVPGYNACILPSEQGYIGLIRQTKWINPQGTYPQGEDIIWYFTLGHNASCESKQLIDTLDRPKYLSWSKGIEDPRLLTPSSFLGVTLDTNNRWKPEISYIQFDSESGSITKVQPLSIENLPLRIEKNWILLEHKDGYAHLLYSMNPIHVLRVDLDSGKGQTLCEHPGLSFSTHNGASVPLPTGGFLITVREKDGSGYKHSFWIKLRSDYTLEAVSKPFVFNTDGGKHYEMCMSLHIEGSELVACLGMDDVSAYIYRLPLESVLASLSSV